MIETLLILILIVLVIAHLDAVVAIGLLVLVLGVMLAIAVGVIAGVIALVIAYPAIMLMFLAIGAACCGYVYWDNQLEAKRKLAARARLGYETPGDYEADSKKPGIDNGVDQKNGEPRALKPSGVHDDDRPC